MPAWIVNVRLRQVEFYGSPQDLALQHGHVFREGDTLDVRVSVVVAELFVKRP